MRSASRPTSTRDARTGIPPALAPLRVRWRLNDPAEEYRQWTRVHVKVDASVGGRERVICGLYVPDFAYDVDRGDSIPEGAPTCKRCVQKG